jgi:hypothetical protein
MTNVKTHHGRAEDLSIVPDVADGTECLGNSTVLRVDALVETRYGSGHVLDRRRRTRGYRTPCPMTRIEALVPGNGVGKRILVFPQAVKTL